MPTRKIDAPTSCDACPFYAFYTILADRCALYPKEPRTSPRPPGTKYPFCRLEGIVVEEKEPGE